MVTFSIVSLLGVVLPAKIPLVLLLTPHPKESTGGVDAGSPKSVALPVEAIVI